MVEVGGGGRGCGRLSDNFNDVTETSKTGNPVENCARTQAYCFPRIKFEDLFSSGLKGQKIDDGSSSSIRDSFSIHFRRSSSHLALLYYLIIDILHQLTETQASLFHRSTWNNRIHPVIHCIPPHWRIQLVLSLNCWT